MSDSDDSAVTVGNRYRIISQIGQGGMGTVYRALDRLTGQTVALKRVTTPGDQLQFKSRSTSSDYHVALAQEFRTLASLRHPHIISVLDYGFDSTQQPYFVMELLDAPKALVAYGLGKPVERRIELLIQLLQALVYLHRRRIIHRDLKPENVLVVKDQVKVLDFGLAVAREHLHEEENSGGTIAYMAPEVLSGEPATESADLYAVGVMAYELFAGEHPFKNPSMGEMIQSILFDTPDVERLDVDEDVQHLVKRLLVKDPDRRYRDANTVIAKLTAAVNLPVPLESDTIRESFLQAAKFIGRDAELRTLTTSLHQITGENLRPAPAAAGCAWLIGGESGVGKSRLLDELRARAMVAGALVLRGQAVEGGGLPYQLWRDPLRRLVISVEVSELEASILKPLIPDIHSLLGIDVPDAPELDGRAAQQRLALTIADVVSRYCLNQPLVLVLEDLQWTVESLIPLKQLLGIIDTLPLMIVGSYRDDERPTLAQELPAAQVMKLTRLSDEAVEGLSVSILGDVGRLPNVLDFIKRETGGNVYFMVEVVRALAAEAGRLSDIGRKPLPSTIIAGGIQQLLQRRLRRISPESQALLGRAALMGRQLDLKVMQVLFDAARYPAGEETPDVGQIVSLAQWLAACADAAILELSDGEWRFAHDKMREAVLIDTPERQRLHREIAGAIEEVHGSDMGYAFTIAEQWIAAHDAQKAAQYTSNALVQLNTISNYADALALGERALALSPQGESAVLVLQHIGETNYRTGKFPQAGEYYRQSRERARQIGDSTTARQREAEALLGESLVAIQTGDYLTARNLSEQSLATQREIGNRAGVARALQTLGGLSYNAGEFEQAKQIYEESLSIRRELDDQFGIALILNNLGILALYQKDYDSARAYYQESLAIRRAAGNRTGIAGSLNNLAIIAYKLDEYAMAEKDFTEALRIYREIGAKRDAAMVLGGMGMLRLAQGDVEAAKPYLHEGLGTARETGAIYLVLEALIGYARVLILEQRYERSAEITGFVATHPGTIQELVTDYIEPLSVELRKMLSEETFSAALERGKSLDLEVVVAEALAHLAE